MHHRAPLGSARRFGYNGRNEVSRMKLLSLLVLLSLGIGCATRTETGYEPRKLGDSATVQRGYYAPPFSPEQRAAESERAVEFQNRRPTDWSGARP